MDQRISSQSDISNLFDAVTKIEKGKSIDSVVDHFPKIKRNFIFLILQEYYRQFENNNVILKKFINIKTPKNIKTILKISLTLLFYSQKPEFAIVNEAVEFSKRFKNFNLVNAVLRKISHNKSKFKNGKENLPKDFKEKINIIFSSKNIRSHIYKSIFLKPKNYQISMTDLSDALYQNRVFNFDKEKKPNCYIQDVGNFECIKSIKDLFESKNIFDMCAAPGGKSILLNSYGFNVEAIDKSYNQIKKFRQNVSQLNIDLKISQKDIFNLDKVENCWSILLDAPCSALGTFRRNPDVISKIDDKKIIENQKIQVRMIEKSLNLLNKGGILAYIVCSFHPFETMGVIDNIIQKHKNITVLNIQSDKMIKKGKGYFINPLSFKEIGGSDIFFVSVLKK